MTAATSPAPLAAPACTHDDHNALRATLEAFHAGTEHIGWSLDEEETLELGTCRRCGSTLARVEAGE